MASIRALGGGPDRLSVDLTIDMNRIVATPLCSADQPGTLACDPEPDSYLFLGAEANLAEPIHGFAFAEIFELEQLADFDLAVLSADRGIGKAPRPFERLR